jgi:hypothetical protein
MRVLVTGAGGNLGKAVVPALVLEGHEPILSTFAELIPSTCSSRGTSETPMR